MVNANFVCVSRGSGPFIRIFLENTNASLLTMVLDHCDADPQDFADMTSITLRDLRMSRYHLNLRFLLGPLTAEDLEVHGPDLDGECMPIGITLRRFTDTHLGKMKRLRLVDTCRDVGCRFLHLTRPLERPFLSLEELILDLPLSQDMHHKLLQLIPAFPVLKDSHIVSRVNETSLDITGHS
ncbi:hypothetical protein IW262DRAFT_534962 [Armillaria fumosa]|nr:hypothetical protein IW262DRAFT_534962 [Armillaria fumosa]